MGLPTGSRFDSFTAGKPRLWSEVRLRCPGIVSNYDVAPDGKRFAGLVSPTDSGEGKPLTQVAFLLNFFDELRRRAAVGGK